MPYAFAERALRVWIPQKVSRQSVWAASAAFDGQRADVATVQREVGQRIAVDLRRVEGLGRPAQAAAHGLRPCLLAAPQLQQVVAARALAVGQRPLHRGGVATRPFEVDAHREVLRQGDDRQRAGVAEVEPQARAGHERLAVLGDVQRHVLGHAPEPRARAGSAAPPARRSTARRVPGASDGQRAHARRRTTAREAAPPAARPAPARLAIPRRCAGVIGYARQLARMLDNEGEVRLAPRASTPVPTKSLGRSGPPSRSSE